MTSQKDSSAEGRKQFGLGDVLSVTGDKLVSPRYVDGVYDVMGFMVGQRLFTHQLVTYHKIVRFYILQQHPKLAEVDDSSVTSKNWREWLDEQIAKYGATVTLEAIPEGKVNVQDPLTDLMEMGVPAEKIIAVKP